MDFGFTPEQELLRDSVREFMRRQCPADYSRQLLVSPILQVGPAQVRVREQSLGILFDRVQSLKKPAIANMECVMPSNRYGLSLNR